MEKSQIKIEPVRIRLPKIGNALMLCMEYASQYPLGILGVVTESDQYFDIELNMSRVAAQEVKKYINNNL